MYTLSGITLLYLAWFFSRTTFALVHSSFHHHAPRHKNGSSSSSSNDHKPKLVLIGGAPGTGKSTFGMSVALQEGILKCISTDTIRAVMRSFVSPEVSPALHRSSYAPAFAKEDTNDDDENNGMGISEDNPVRTWKETCTVLHSSVLSLVQDAMERKTSLVVEGVHLIPNDELIKTWQEGTDGGIAVGCLLQVQNADTHKALLQRRGYLTGNMDKENKKIASYDRIRKIQEEMMALADASGWLRIEQKTEPDPLDIVSARLWGVDNDFDVTDLVSNQPAHQRMIFTNHPQSAHQSNDGADSGDDHNSILGHVELNGEDSGKKEEKEDATNGVAPSKGVDSLML